MMMLKDALQVLCKLIVHACALCACVCVYMCVAYVCVYVYVFVRSMHMY